MELHPLPFFFPPSNDFDDDGGILDELCEYRSALESDVGGQGALLAQLRDGGFAGFAAVAAASEAESDGAGLSMMSPMLASSAGPGSFAGGLGGGGGPQLFPAAARPDWGSGQANPVGNAPAGDLHALSNARPLRGGGAAEARAHHAAPASAGVPEWPGRVVAPKRPRQEDESHPIAASSSSKLPAGPADAAGPPRAAKVPRKEAEDGAPSCAANPPPPSDAMASGPSAAEAATAEAMKQAELALAEETAAAQATLAGLAGANSELKRREWNRLNARKSR